jgi:hypothetical protein
MEHSLLELLEAAFGEKRTKEIVDKVNVFKKKNPNRSFDFIFDENGNFDAVPRKEENSNRKIIL